MNLEKAREVAFMIRKDETHWYQGSWYSPPATRFYEETDETEWYVPAADLLDFECGTTACVAGWAVALNHPDAVFHGWGDVLQDGVLIGLIDALAEHDLELTPEQSVWLFNGNRSKEEVLWALETEDPDWTPDDWYPEGVTAA